MVKCIAGNYIHIVENDSKKALKVGDFLCKDITIVGTDTDISSIEEVELENNE